MNEYEKLRMKAWMKAWLTVQAANGCTFSARYPTEFADNFLAEFDKKFKQSEGVQNTKNCCCKSNEKDLVSKISFEPVKETKLFLSTEEIKAYIDSEIEREKKNLREYPYYNLNVQYGISNEDKEAGK